MVPGVVMSYLHQSNVVAAMLDCSSFLSWFILNIHSFVHCLQWWRGLKENRMHFYFYVNTLTHAWTVVTDSVIHVTLLTSWPLFWIVWSISHFEFNQDIVLKKIGGFSPSRICSGNLKTAIWGLFGRFHEWGGLWVASRWAWLCTSQENCWQLSLFCTQKTQMSHENFFSSKVTNLEFVRRHLTKKNHWQDPWWRNSCGTDSTNHVEIYLFLYAPCQQEAACSCNTVAVATEKPESSLQRREGEGGRWGVGSSHRIPSLSLDFHKLSMQCSKCDASKMSELVSEHWRQIRPSFSEQATGRQWSRRSWPKWEQGTWKRLNLSIKRTDELKRRR